MTDIRILSDILTNKIAAGEVVERPVSVVKELVENALDAGATRITAEIVKGGRDLIRIADNGSGMSRDNALLAIERYATSKIFTDEDLFSIKTFGFRGEALPSMAAVSRFTLTTRERQSDLAVKIQINGGRVVDVEDAGAPIGTMVEVAQLYFNTPARRKFLKGIGTEMGHIADVFTGMALGAPGVGFRLLHNDRLVKAFSASATMETRAGEVFGLDALSKLRQIELAADGITVTGFLSDPVDPLFTRGTSKNLRLFVNNRLVNDRSLVAAILQGYRGRLMKGRYPLGLVFVTLAPDRVDVNVHPSKLEVRFVDQQRVFSLVVRAVRDAFLRSDGVAPSVASGSSGVEYGAGQPEDGKKSKDPESQDGEATDGDSADSMGRPRKRHTEPSLFQWGAPPGESSSVSAPEPLFNKPSSSDHPLPDESQAGPPLQGRSSLGMHLHKPGQPIPGALLKPGPAPSPQECRQPGSEPVVIGQVFGTYIIVQDGRQMVLVDQHAAHERIVYDRLKQRSDGNTVPSQTLAVPETLELTYAEADLLESILPDLAAVGMEIEPFGGTAFIVKSVPAIIDHRDVRPLVLDIVARLAESGGDPGHVTGQWLDDCLILMACHSAIRANQALNLREMQALLLQLDSCENPDHCPHGRPIRIRWGINGLERLFRRVV
ncbi:MAG: DNA mismatch repair endonuclease MutL [Desulfobacterium sp.]|nr:DNA mismatch repair endonuclease MutL [Desulfobacterium sp.]